VITGHVSAEGEPTISLPVAGKNWTAVVDTGFNGDLELPEPLRPLVNPRYLLRAKSFLASGQSLDEDVYLVELAFDGQDIVAEATFAPGDTILLGTHLLRHYRLTVDFVARTVLLERLV
jgi:predicted aspartyl protease